MAPMAQSVKKFRQNTLIWTLIFITIVHLGVLASQKFTWIMVLSTWIIASIGAVILIYFAFYRVEKIQANLQTQLGLSLKNSQRQAAIASLSGGFTTTLIENDVCRELVQRLHQVQDYDYVAVYLLDEKGVNRQLRANIGGLGSPNAHTLPAGIGLSEQPILDGKLQYTPDVTQNPKYIPGLGRGSEVDVPIEYDREILGVLVIETLNTHAFEPEDFQLLTTASDQAAIAIQNSRLLAVEVERRRMADILRSATLTVSSQLDLDQVLDRILSQLAKMVPFDSTCVFLWRDDYLQAKAARGLPSPEEVIGKSFPADNELFHIILNTKKPVILDDIRDDPRFMGWGGTSKMGSWMGIPLLIDNQIIGYLTLDHREIKAYDQEKANLAMIFAYQAAVALQNAQLYNTAKIASEKLMILHEASQQITSSSFDPDRTYFAIHKAAEQLMPCESFCITILDEVKDEIEAVYLIDRNGRAPSIRVPADQGLSGYLIAKGEPILVKDFQQSEIAKDFTPIHFGGPDSIRALIAVPMRLGNKIVGMLSAQSYKPYKYSNQDQLLLEMLAAHAAIALNNAHLFSQIQHLAITDSLTNIYNRRYFFDAAQREFSRALRYKNPISLIMLDLDNYKTINDTAGHLVGDMALVIIANHFVENIRESDIVCRYGGDEFSIILPETDLTQALEFAERLRVLIGETPIEIEQNKFSITLSVGVASINEKTTDLSQLLISADKALYDAKNGGRNRVCYREWPLAPASPA